MTIRKHASDVEPPMIARAAILAVSLFAAAPTVAMELTSSDVADGKPFDRKFVCADHGGANISPALSWSGVPANAKSLSLTIFDPDAGFVGYWHWVALDIPAAANGLAQGAGSGKAPLPPGTVQRDNDNGDARYDGPCPPSGLHHYQITLYALADAKPAVDPKATAKETGAWLSAHAIATARITPVFSR